MVYEYQRSLASMCEDPAKFLKAAAQIQGKVEVASKEKKNAFVDRENENPMMLRYPKRDAPSYQCK